ncbi:hypothetical protein ACFSYG_04075, partial [Leeuwenhoekiella polynyae]
NALDIKSMSIKKALWVKRRTIEKNYEGKFGIIIGYAMGSKSKIKLMKSYKNIQREATPKKTKKENAQDIISKSLQKNINANCLNGSDSILINL